jgi:hypothetical protein
MDDNKSLGTLALAALIVGFLHKLGENLADLAAKYLAREEEEDEDEDDAVGTPGGLHIHVHPPVFPEAA